MNVCGVCMLECVDRMCVQVCTFACECVRVCASALGRPGLCCLRLERQPCLALWLHSRASLVSVNSKSPTLWSARPCLQEPGPSGLPPHSAQAHSVFTHTHTHTGVHACDLPHLHISCECTCGVNWACGAAARVWASAGEETACEAQGSGRKPQSLRWWNWTGHLCGKVGTGLLSPPPLQQPQGRLNQYPP